MVCGYWQLQNGFIQRYGLYASELSAIGTLTIVYEKLDDLQETICKQADKI
jgi:hypothetical protein